MEPVKQSTGPAWFAPYAKMRTEGYVILASLLGRRPSENLLKILQTLQWDQAIPEGVDSALRALCRGSHKYSRGALEEEYDKLFVGLGSGELVPYASWYKEKKIQSSLLAFLRSDLIRLGIMKKADSFESEDHAGALCECMALISGRADEIPLAAQAKFFQQHIAPWIMIFFQDLESANSSRFYRTVAVFGRRFMVSEIEYLKSGGGA